MSDPSIHIVLPTYNRGRLLSEIGPQYYATQPYIERIVIVNDASTDDSAEQLGRWAESDSRVLLLNSEKRLGACGSRNLGLSHCTGSHIMIGEDDICYEPGSTAVLIEQMDLLGADLIACSLYQLSEEVSEIGDFSDRHLSSNPHFLDDRYLYCHCDADVESSILAPLVHGCFLAKREVFEKVHYDEALGFDYFRDESDFQLCAWRAGFKVAFTPETRAYHLPFGMRSGGCHDTRNASSLLRDHWGRFYNNHYFWKKHADFLEEVLPRKRTTAETLFFVHCLAEAGYKYAGLLKDEGKPIRSALMRTLLAPAAALEKLTIPPEGYGTKGFPKLIAYLQKKKR